MNNLFLFLLDMPPAVKGQVRPNAEGDYYIFLNAIYNTQQLRETYNHEVRHLLLGHHYVEDVSIEKLEAQADCKSALLEQIRAAEENGLPLESALLAAAKGKTEPCKEPESTNATGAGLGVPNAVENTDKRTAMAPAPLENVPCNEQPGNSQGWWQRLQTQVRSVMTNLWY